MSANRGRTGDGLLERELECRSLEQAIDRACAGDGGAVVIEGHAGIGKTSLLAYARESGTRRDMRVVSATGAELEWGFPYGVVRQFFESFLRTVPPAERKTWLRGTAEMAGTMFGGRADRAVEPGEQFALLHSLYWMCVNIAEGRPLLMLLDDAQWADLPSLRYVEFTCRRLEQVPLLFVVATRLADEHTPAPLMALLAGVSVDLLRPSPLSLRAVESLVRDQVDPRADDEFAAACHEVTGGNPFLLRELLHEVVRERVPATKEGAARVRAIGPRGIARVVLLRLRRLPEPARLLVAALSVAPDGLPLRELGELAGLDERACAEAAAGLASAEIVDLRDGIRFTHPVLRTTVYEDMAALERQRLHRRAATMQAERGRPAEEIAAHLLELEPGDDPSVIRTLREAAAQATAARDFLDAERLLLRARQESADGVDRADLLAELGSVQARAGKPAGIANLRAAIDEIENPLRRAEVSIKLSTALKFSLDIDQSAQVLLEAIRRADVPSRQIRRRLHAELLGTRFIAAVSDPHVRTELASLEMPSGPPRDQLDSLQLAAAAYDAAAELRPAAEVIEFGRRALFEETQGGPAYRRQAPVIASVALIWAEDLEFVYARCSRAVAAAQAESSALGVGTNLAVRAICCYRAGRLLDAESDAAAAIELAPTAGGLGPLLPSAVACAIASGIDRGTPLKELEAMAFDRSLDRAPQLLAYTQLSWARGELCLADEQWEQALAHLGDCDRHDPSLGGNNPAMIPWREGIALAHARLGDHTAAYGFASEAVHRAERFGAPRALGCALRAAALVQSGRARIAGLRRARETLERATAPLELARVCCDLGSTLRAAGQRTDAQQTLEQSYRLANSLGAERIAGRAAEELKAAGVRPRREPAAGPGALTPSERRVAELAAAGKSNREIAQTLFVTQKTVETHLGHVYDKLGVRARQKLSEALTGREGGIHA
jgi:DNA-binding CsgD family transcriptional regulator